MLLDKIRKNREYIGYGIMMALLFVLLQWIEFNFLIKHHSYEIYAGCIALIFTVFGIWIAKKLIRPKVQTILIEKKVSDFSFNEEEMLLRKISKRELEVLELMSEGLSNQEIAEKLFISLNTIKTHSSKLFEKLEVKRRTQAVETAKKLQLIP